MGKIKTPSSAPRAVTHRRDEIDLHAKWRTVIDEAVRVDDAGEPRRALVMLAPLLAATVEQAPSPHLAAKAQYAAGQCALSLADYAASDRHSESALAIACAARDSGTEAMVLSLRAQIRYHQGNYNECLALARRAAEVSSAHGYESLAAEAYIPQIMAYAGRGAFECGRECVAKGIAHAERGDSALMRAQLYNAAGLHHYYEGLARVLTPEMNRQVALLDAESIAPARGDFELAEARLRKAINIVDALGELRFSDAMRANLYRVLVLIGKAEEAIPFLKKHIRNTQRRALVSDEISARHAYAWALRSLGHHEESLAQVDAALALSRRAGRVNRLV
ncbi:MAG: hypothetical protein JNJ55_11295, partial [Betaproteobacteria bacterium]|nr:hypothetical protein [Betaproteobacteria bacterium]